MIKTTLAPTAPWPTKPHSPGRPRKKKEPVFSDELDPLQVAREHLAPRVKPALEKVLMTVYLDDKGNVVSMKKVKPACQPARSGLHGYMGRYANIWTAGFRAAESYHKIGTTKKRTK